MKNGVLRLVGASWAPFGSASAKAERLKDGCLAVFHED